MGSGTTAVSCVNLDRRYIGFEISEKYFDIATNRVNKVLSKKLTTEKASDFWG
jgi:DNA modification methylase